ncbi:MAG: hypothetical protein PGN13_11145, partial [Patulibacter minatonensis]
ASSPRSGLDDLRDVLQDHAGESGVLIELLGDGNGHGEGVVRRLTLGEEFRVRRSAGLAFALEEAVPGLRVALADPAPVPAG